MLPTCPKRERGRGVTSRVKATQSWASRTLLTAGIGEMCSAQGRTRAADVAVGEQADNAASPSMLAAACRSSYTVPPVAIYITSKMVRANSAGI